MKGHLPTYDAHDSHLLQCMQSSTKFASELCHLEQAVKVAAILVFGLLLPVGGMKFIFLLHG